MCSRDCAGAFSGCDCGMTLSAFQRALTDLTASPSLCRAARADSGLLARRYALTEREARRLDGIVQSKGMEANCILYRANRLAPVALNCPGLCKALSTNLNRLISEYWEAEPTTNVHFLVETDRFCRFLSERADLPAGAKKVLEHEHAWVKARLTASRALGGDGFAEQPSEAARGQRLTAPGNWAPRG